MNLNHLTLKTQEAVQAAQQYAFEKGHPQIENEHLFYGLLEVDDTVLPFIFNKLQDKATPCAWLPALAQMMPFLVSSDDKEEILL